MRSRRRLRDRRRRRANRSRALVIGAALVVGVIALSGAAAIDAVGDDLRTKGGAVKEIRLGENSRIFDNERRLLGRIAGTTNRTEVPLGRIPKAMRQATVAIEDERFYSHDGVDYKRVAGAAWHDLRTGTTAQGGSTITMQLVKNLYEPGAERTFERKLEEAYLAYQYEKKYTKDQILGRYLNGVFYGANAVGVQAASLTYFNRPVWKITLGQAALLAGLPQAPSAYSPFANPEAARERRNDVLDKMAELGYIDRATADRTQRSGLNLKRGNPYEVKREGYVFEYVRESLIDRFGVDEVQAGGFQVFTTIDPDLQTAAEQAIKDVLYLDDDPAAAIVMIDTQTGFIRAMATSQRYGSDSQFNLAAQALRQTGSTFKTFVLARAIEEGINPASTFYESKPLNFTDDEYGLIDVATYGNSYRGVIPVDAATLASDNSVYQQLTLDVGPPDVKEIAERMGIPKKRDIKAFASIGLGANEVTPLDLVTAYAPLSNGGLRVDPIAISKIVTPSGRVIVSRPKRKRIFPDGVAYEVTRILRDNITGGTGGNANIGIPMAGKTGTTDDFVDAWFAGYTPRYATVVWVGYPNNEGVKRYMDSVHGIPVAGGSFPAQIWNRFMSVALEGQPVLDFPLPQNPVEWQSFSSDFTAAAAASKARVESEAAAQAASEAAADEAAKEAARRLERALPQSTPDDLPDLLPPDDPQVPAPAPDPTAPPAVEPPPAAPPPVDPAAPVP